MIRGRFEPALSGAPDAPFVQAGVRLGGTHAFTEVGFLIDTGAEFTTILPRDALALWPEYLAHDFLNDPSRTSMVGIGGTADFVPRRVEVEFTDDGAGAVVAAADLWIPAWYQSELWHLPSLLGRDLLRRFTLVVSPPANTVSLTL